MGAQRIELDICRTCGKRPKYYIKSANIYTLSDDPKLFAGISSINHLDISCDNTLASWRKLRKNVLNLYNVKLPRFAYMVEWKKYTYYYNAYVARITKDI